MRNGVLILLCLLLLNCAPPGVRAEQVEFRSASIPPSPLKQRIAQREGATASAEQGGHLTGELYRPAGEGRFPAIVALHGCAGRPDATAEQAFSRRFTHQGFIVLWVDSFAPRLIANQCTFVPTPPDRVLDAYGALDWLAGQRFVDPDRVVILGFAQGGTAALGAVSPSGYAEELSRRRFAGAIALSPLCYPGFSVVRVPALILADEQDDSSSAKECRAMMARRTGEGAVERLIVLPAAFPQFSPAEAYGNGPRLADDMGAPPAAFAAMFGFLKDVLGR